MEPTIPSWKIDQDRSTLNGQQSVLSWTILDNLPSELQCLILNRLTRAEKTLTLMTCRSWHDLIRQFSPGLRTNPNLLLYHAAKYGYENLLILAKLWGVDDFKEGMRIASIKGRLEIMKTLFEWEKIEQQKLKSPSHLLIQTALIWSSYGGHPKGMRLAKSWGAKKYGQAIEKASEGGYPDCMKLALDWMEEDDPLGSVYILLKHAREALKLAASNAHLKCMRLAVWWGVSDYDSAMREAAKKGHMEAMLLLKMRDKGRGTLNFSQQVIFLAKEIDKLKKTINRNNKNDPYRQYKSGSYVELKIKGAPRKRLIKIPTISQRAATRSYFQAKLEKLIKCLRLLESWKKQKMEI